VPRHDTNPLGCRALWHGTALSEGFSAVPGPECGHGDTTRHGTTVTPCLIVPCRVVLVPCSASAARLENYILLRHRREGMLKLPLIPAFERHNARCAWLVIVLLFVCLHRYRHLGVWGSRKWNDTLRVCMHALQFADKISVVLIAN
jgi:hypothetical protein